MSGEIPDDLAEFRDPFVARTRRTAALVYIVLGVWVALATGTFVADFASASGSERRTALIVFAGVAVLFGAVQWWNLRHPSSPETSRRIQVGTMVVVVSAVLFGGPLLARVSDVVLWAGLSAAGIMSFCGFALARRRVIHDPRAIVKAREQAWSNDRPFADYFGGFFRRTRKP